MTPASPRRATYTFACLTAEQRGELREAESATE